MSTQSPDKVLRREDSDNGNPGTSDTSFHDWPVVIYALAEQFGMDSDPLKCHFVRELYSAGFDSVAKEVLKDLLINVKRTCELSQFFLHSRHLKYDPKAHWWRLSTASDWLLLSRENSKPSNTQSE